MKPTIDGTKFGSITVDGDTFDHDIVIRLGGKVKKRKKSKLKGKKVHSCASRSKLWKASSGK